MKHHRIISTESGLISGNLYNIPNRWFLPQGLYQVSCDGDNLNYAGCNISRVLGAAIGLSYRDALGSAMGEFFERYCAAFEQEHKLIKGTYQELSAKGHHLINIALLQYYADWQYETLPYKPLNIDSEISWIKGYDYVQKRTILVPAFSVFLPHNRYFDNEDDYLLNTSTGVAAGATKNDAIKGGFLECAEREAFTKFWYLQEDILDSIPIYTPRLILETYKENEIIKQLYDNQKVKICIFDLTSLVPVETFVVFLFFKYKGRIFQSMGSASRFNKEDALIKAILEAYQGIEYSILLDRKEENWNKNEDDFSNVDDFSRHFAFYNRFPELRREVPIIRKAMEGKANTKTINEYTNKMKSMEDIDLLEIPHLIAVDLSTCDAQEAKFEVVRTLTPSWSLLTGMHSRPFLGSKSFRENSNNYLKYPHPFP
jgi:ribosomal protein S12 methylthiotransferase accessory factor